MSYLICAELHDDIDVLFVLEDVFETYYVLVTERFVDLDLCLQLCSQPFQCHLVQKKKRALEPSRKLPRAQERIYDVEARETSSPNKK